MNVATAADFKNLWPEHSAEELANLERNCLDDPKHERMPPIVLWADGPKPNTIIEGYHQHAIRERHRLTIKYAKLKFETRQDAMIFALRAQLGRRNLNASQLAIGLAELSKIVGKNGTPGVLNLESAAKEAGISTQTAYNAKKVSEQGSKPLVDSVKAGETAVSDAVAVADLPKPEQTAALKKVQSGRAKTLRGAAFDPEQLEKQPPTRRPKKSGKPIVTKKERTEVQKHLGGLIRCLKTLELYDEFEPALSAIAKRLKQI